MNVSIRREDIDLIAELTAIGSDGSGVTTGLTVGVTIQRMETGDDYWNTISNAFNLNTEPVAASMTHIRDGLYAFTLLGGAQLSEQSYRIHFTVTGNPEVNTDITISTTIWAAPSDATLANQSTIISNIAALNNISAANVWAAGTRELTGIGSSGISSQSTQDIIDANVDTLNTNVPDVLSLININTATYPGGFVYYDAAAGNTNTVIGVDGIPSNPVSSLAAATTLADALGTKSIKIRGLLTIGSISNYIFVNWNAGERHNSFATSTSQIDINTSSSLINNVFKGLKIQKGNGGSLSENVFYECQIPSLTAQEIGGVYRRCSFDGGTYTVINDTLIYDMFAMRGSNATFSLTGSNVQLRIYNAYMDKITLTNSTTASTFIYRQGGEVEAAASCTGGNINLFGDMKITDNSAGATVIKTTVGLLNWASEDLTSGANMIEDDSGDKRWTAQALEQVPSGGGDATEAKQDTIIANQAVQGLEAKQDTIITNQAAQGTESKQDTIIASQALQGTEAKQDTIIASQGLQGTESKQDTIIASQALQGTDAKQDTIIANQGTASADIVLIKAKTDELPSQFKKGVAYSNFPVFMVLASDGKTAATGLTVTGQIQKDNGAFAALTNPVVEISLGFYRVDLTVAEMTADNINLVFAATTADDRPMSFPTNP